HSDSRESLTTKSNLGPPHERCISKRSVTLCTWRASGHRRIGINNPATVALRGETYERPIETPQSYLGRMKEVPFMVPRPAEEPPVVLAAFNLETSVHKRGKSAAPTATVNPAERERFLAVESDYRARFHDRWRALFDDRLHFRM